MTVTVRKHYIIAVNISLSENIYKKKKKKKIYGEYHILRKHYSEWRKARLSENITVKFETVWKHYGEIETVWKHYGEIHYLYFVET